MRERVLIALFWLILSLLMGPCSAQAEASDPRLAFVIGNADYSQTPLPTAVNDAALVAQTLLAAGFDVTGAANLDQQKLRRAFDGFLERAKAAGPHAIVFVYLSGYGLQYAGENYFVPVNVSLRHDTDIPFEAIRISDFTRALAATSVQCRIFVLDAARENPFATSGGVVANGLTLAEVEPGSLLAINAAPGMTAPAEKAPYGAYAKALAEMLRYGGVPLDEAFVRLRLRVNEMTHGAFVPWHVSKFADPPALLAAATTGTTAAPRLETYAALRSEPVRDYADADEAYAATIDSDTLSGYQEFLAAFPDDALYARIKALLAYRREALTWAQAVRTHYPNAYWSYMRRYPEGPHISDARRVLAGAQAPLDPPPRFDSYDFEGLAAPDDEERAIIDHPAFGAGGLDYAPVPTVSARFLPPLPAAFRQLPTPEPQSDGALPIPAPIALIDAQAPFRAGHFARPELESLANLPANPNSEPVGAAPATQPAADLAARSAGLKPKLGAGKPHLHPAQQPVTSSSHNGGVAARAAP